MKLLFQKKEDRCSNDFKTNYTTLKRFEILYEAHRLYCVIIFELKNTVFIFFSFKAQFPKTKTEKQTKKKNNKRKPHNTNKTSF